MQLSSIFERLRSPRPPIAGQHGLLVRTTPFPLRVKHLSPKSRRMTRVGGGLCGAQSNTVGNKKETTDAFSSLHLSLPMCTYFSFASILSPATTMRRVIYDLAAIGALPQRKRKLACLPDGFLCCVHSDQLQSCLLNCHTLPHLVNTVSSFMKSLS